MKQKTSNSARTGREGEQKRVLRKGGSHSAMNLQGLAGSIEVKCMQERHPGQFKKL